jgi:hypothetical protein
MEPTWKESREELMILSEQTWNILTENSLEWYPEMALSCREREFSDFYVIIHISVNL